MAFGTSVGVPHHKPRTDALAATIAANALADASALADLTARLDAEGVVNLKWAGAAADGVTDDTAVLIDALATGKRVYAPAGTYRLTAGISLPDGAVIEGDGPRRTLFDFGDAPASSYFVATGASVLAPLRGLRLADFGTVQGTRTGVGVMAAVEFRFVAASAVERLHIDGAEDIGLWWIDCDGCVARDVLAENVAYVVNWDGCSACYGERLRGLDISLHAFAILADDGLAPAPSNESSSVRAREDAGGNVLMACSVDRFEGHAVTLNACDGNAVIGMQARHYVGAEADRPAFQNKHTTNDESRRNKFIGCDGYDLGGGFYSQDGAGMIVVGGTLDTVSGNGCWANSAPGTVFSDVTMRGIGGDVLRLEASPYSRARGIASAAPGAAARGLILINSSYCRVDDFELTDLHATGASIDSLSGSTTLGGGVRLGSSPLADASTTTKYPLVYQAVVDTGAIGQTVLGVPPRGMWVGRARAMVAEAPTSGDPAIRVGSVLSTGMIAAQQTLGSLALGAVNLLTLAAADAGTAPVLSCNVGVAATGGKLVVSVEGLHRI